MRLKTYEKLLLSRISPTVWPQRFVDLEQANDNMKKFSDRAKDVLKKAKVFFGK